MKNKKKFIKVLFPKPISAGTRNWGGEKILVIIPKILSLKILNIKKGKKGGLQYHHKKNECGYVSDIRIWPKYNSDSNTDVFSVEEKNIKKLTTTNNAEI